MARDSEQAGESLKRRSPGMQARASRENVINLQEENVMNDTTAIAVERNGAAEQAALVQVFSGQIGGQTVNVCDARELHAYLQSGDKFADWIKARIEKYGFEENRDFAVASGNSEAKRGGHNRKDYHLSLDMAKELSMVENNEQGRVARRYFIDMERRALGLGVATPSAPVDAQEFITLHYLRFALRLLVESGKVWFSAASLANIFGLRSSDRVYRTLPQRQTHRVQRGRQVLVFVDYDAVLATIGHAPAEKGQAFRTWLDEYLASVQPSAARPKALPHGLSVEQQTGLKALVSARLSALPVNLQAGAARKCWGALSGKFGCSYKEIPPEQYIEACNLIGRLPLEGEWLEPEPQAPAPSLNIDYPARWLLEQNPDCFQQAKLFGPDLFISVVDLTMYKRSAVAELLAELDRAGYCVEAARYEFEAQRHYLRHLEQSNRLMAGSLRGAMQMFEEDRRMGKRFPGALAVA